MMKVTDRNSSEERIAGTDYKLFALVVELGSLAAAGKALRLSAPMVSKRLTRLERRLGVRLVHRSTRRLALTEQGRAFHEDVLSILAAIADAEDRVCGHEGAVRGPLRISAPTSFGRLHVAPHLKRFLDDYPQVRVTLDLSDSFVDLVTDRIDLAVRVTSNIARGLNAQRLATSRRILCAAPSYIAAHGLPVDLAALGTHRLLAAKDQLPWRLAGPEGLRLVNGESAVQTNSSEVVRELALQGTGIALRSLWDVNHDVLAGRLVRVLSAFEGSADVGIYAVYPHASLLAPAVAAMISHLLKTYTPTAPWE